MFSYRAHPCLSSVAHDGPQEPRSVDEHPCVTLYDHGHLQSLFVARPLGKYASSGHHMSLPIA